MEYFQWNFLVWFYKTKWEQGFPYIQKFESLSGNQKVVTLILVCMDFKASLGEARIFNFSAGVENLSLSSMHAAIKKIYH